MQPLWIVSSLEEVEYNEEICFIAPGPSSFACRLQYPSDAHTYSHTNTHTNSIPYPND